MKLCLVVLLAVALSDGRDAEPGMKTRVTLKGLQYGWQLGLQEMQRRLDTVQIPDVKGDVSVDVLGKIGYYVTQLQVRSVDLSNSSLSFSPEAGVTALIQGGQIQIQGHIQIRTSLFSASSWLVLEVRGLSVTGSLGITCDDFGHGLVWDAGCSSAVGRVDLWFQGGSGWLFNMFRSRMMGPIRDTLSTQICPGFEQAVIHMEQALSSLPVSLSVDLVSSLEFGLVGPPLITGESLDLPVKGQFIGHAERWDLPGPPEEMLIPDVESHMLLVALSQFSANSAAFVHYKAGALNYNITDDMVPKLSPIRLNTKSLAIFVPELSSRYPDPLPVLLQVSARSPPTVTCEPDSLTLHLSADIGAFVTQPHQPPTSIFQIQADSLTGVDVVLSEQTVGAAISVNNFSLSLVHSDVGPVKVDTMQKTLNFALKMVVPIVNEHLRNIFPLPTDVLHLQNPVTHVLKGYVLIMTDLEASSPPPQNLDNRREPSH